MAKAIADKLSSLGKQHGATRPPAGHRSSLPPLGRASSGNHHYPPTLQRYIKAFVLVRVH